MLNNKDDFGNSYEYGHWRYNSIDVSDLSESGLVNYYKIKHSYELKDIRGAQDFIRKYGIVEYKRYVKTKHEQHKRYNTVFSKLVEERPMSPPTGIMYYVNVK